MSSYMAYFHLLKLMPPTMCKCKLCIFVYTIYINLVGKCWIFGDVDHWQNQTDQTFNVILWNGDRQIQNQHHERNMYVFCCGLTWMFVHAKRPPDYYVLFVNCHVCITLSSDNAWILMCVMMSHTVHVQNITLKTDIQ